MSTFKIVAVSNWRLFQEYYKTKELEAYANYLLALQELPLKPDMLILREKSMKEPEYEQLLKMTKNGNNGNRLEVIPHTYLEATKRQGLESIHLPLFLLEQCHKQRKLGNIKKIGASIHSAEEAKRAEEWGASYLTAGHIFITDCKKGVEPRGIDFLEDICKSTKLSVYAIGGIHPKNLKLIKKTGAAGACMMSEFLCS